MEGQKLAASSDVDKLLVYTSWVPPEPYRMGRGKSLILGSWLQWEEKIISTVMCGGFGEKYACVLDIDVKSTLFLEIVKITSVMVMGYSAVGGEDWRRTCWPWQRWRSYYQGCRSEARHTLLSLLAISRIERFCIPRSFLRFPHLAPSNLPLPFQFVFYGMNGWFVCLLG